MRKSWAEFKAFAMGGNMLDLALGFIIGAAFAALVESLANNVLLQLVAAIFGKPDFTALVLTVNGAEIKYGAFITDFVSFVLLGLVLFGIVKVIKRAGMGNFRAQGSAQCPHCKRSSWRSTPSKCKWCTADIDPERCSTRRTSRCSGARLDPPEPTTPDAEGSSVRVARGVGALPAPGIRAHLVDGPRCPPPQLGVGKGRVGV